MVRSKGKQPRARSNINDMIKALPPRFERIKHGEATSCRRMSPGAKGKACVDNETLGSRRRGFGAS